MDVSAAVAIGLAVWTATNVVLTGVKMVNERRDAILLSTLDKQPLTPTHKRLLLYADWLPMWGTLSLFMIFGALILLTLPWWAVGAGWANPSNPFLIYFAIFGGLMFCVAAVSGIIGGVIEFRVMHRALDSVVDKPTTNTATRS